MSSTSRTVDSPPGEVAPPDGWLLAAASGFTSTSSLFASSSSMMSSTRSRFRRSRFKLACRADHEEAATRCDSMCACVNTCATVLLTPLPLMERVPPGLGTTCAATDVGRPALPARSLSARGSRTSALRPSLYSCFNMLSAARAAAICAFQVPEAQTDAASFSTSLARDTVSARVSYCAADTVMEPWPRSDRPGCPLLTTSFLCRAAACCSCSRGGQLAAAARWCSRESSSTRPAHA
mmetsp:Transcript_13688/g.29375  ORF Transcript_13688/g.29375 Transcript_13688/m.29375 type:complete len:237 (-) Transcript_13688:1765-2475(-)